MVVLWSKLIDMESETELKRALTMFSYAYVHWLIFGAHQTVIVDSG